MGWSFRTKLRAIVRSSMPEGYPSVERVAERLNVRVRTLQRRLNEQGLTYSDLVETFRYREASRLLDGGRRSSARSSAPSRKVAGLPDVARSAPAACVNGCAARST